MQQTNAGKYLRAADGMLHFDDGQLLLLSDQEAEGKYHDSQKGVLAQIQANPGLKMSFCFQHFAFLDAFMTKGRESCYGEAKPITNGN